MKLGIFGPAAQSRLLVLALALIICSGCTGQAAGPAATPSPTIAAPPARPSPTPGAPATQPPARPTPSATPPPATQPSATPPPAAQSSATPPAGAPASVSPTPPAPFAYLWPTALPPNMQISSSESRVASDTEIGKDGQGFFIVTFTDGTAKLVMGGGATEALPLTGEQRRLTVGGREATLTTNGDQRQLIFAVPRGKLFVYSLHLSEEQLLEIAGSLQPIAVQDLRALVGQA